MDLRFNSAGSDQLSHSYSNSSIDMARRGRRFNGSAAEPLLLLFGAVPAARREGQSHPGAIDAPMPVYPGHPEFQKSLT